MFIWIICVVIVISVFAWRRLKKAQPFSLIDDAKPWFDEIYLDFESIRFSTYEAELAKSKDALPLIGSGRTITNETVGFVIEVVPGKGVVESSIITPAILTSHHKMASFRARNSQLSLIEVMHQMMLEFYAKKPPTA